MGIMAEPPAGRRLSAWFTTGPVARDSRRAFLLCRGTVSLQRAGTTLLVLGLAVAWVRPAQPVQHEGDDTVGLGPPTGAVMGRTDAMQRHHHGPGVHVVANGAVLHGGG